MNCKTQWVDDQVVDKVDWRVLICLLKGSVMSVVQNRLIAKVLIEQKVSSTPLARQKDLFVGYVRYHP